MTPVIEVTGLTKRYGGQAVVDGISFHVEQGEIFGILGPNGAGKTTAVECWKACGGATRARSRSSGSTRRPTATGCTSGSACSSRRPAAGQAEGTRGLDCTLVLPGPGGLARAAGALGAGRQERHRFGKLSGGQKQRLFIALALIGNPEVVFLDELTAGLDPGPGAPPGTSSRRSENSGVTVVLVSHFMDEVEELCDRVAILERGRIAALDTPAGLVDSAGGEYRMRFQPMAPLDEQSLDGVPGVDRRRAAAGRRVAVTGTGDFASAVTAELARRQVVVADLRIEGRSLDSAYVALTGRTMDT